MRLLRTFLSFLLVIVDVEKGISFDTKLWIKYKEYQGILPSCNINHIVKPLLCFQLNLQWKNGKHNHSENPSSLIVQTSPGFLKFLIKRNLTLEYDKNWTLIKMKTWKQGMLDMKGTYLPFHKIDIINIPWAYMDLPHTLCWKSKSTIDPIQHNNIFMDV